MNSIFTKLSRTLLAALLLAANTAVAQQSAAGSWCQLQALAPLLGASLQVAAIAEVNRAGWPAELPELGHEFDAQAMNFCRVTAIASAGQDSEIHMEFWLPPLAVWNGKLVGTGNGGFNPALSYNDMLLALQRGYAVVGGDTGHHGPNAGDVSFGRGHPEKIRDWAERSIHVITVAAKQMILAMTQQAPTRSYYYGCSTGGHQGLAEVQRYPDDYDGVIAGDPANNRIRWNAQSLWQYKANHIPGTTTPVVTAKQLPLIARRVLEKCDALDGRQDGVLEDPRQCTLARIDLPGLACNSGSSEQCLTAAQITALEKIYQGLRDTDTGQQLYPGLQPGSEDGWGGFLGSNPPRGDFWRYWVDDTDDFDVWSFDFVAEIRKADHQLGAVIDSVNPDLSAFHKHGGKLIVYHGWGDAGVSPLDSIAYFDKVKQKMGAQAVDDFYRLYVVPGMGHCGGGKGATVFGNAANQAPQPDSSNDLLLALDRWVETAQAPSALHSVEIRDNTVVSTRLLCSWPLQGGPGSDRCLDEPAAVGTAASCEKNTLVATTGKNDNSAALCLNNK